MERFDIRELSFLDRSFSSDIGNEDDDDLSDEFGAHSETRIKRARRETAILSTKERETAKKESCERKAFDFFPAVMQRR